jgi:hypothetical protein
MCPQGLQTLKALLGTAWYEQHMMLWDHLNALIVLNAVINPFLYGDYQQCTTGCYQADTPPL